MEHSLELFQRGGFVMYALLLCSVVVAVIGIERFRFYRQASRNATSFIAKLPLMGEGDTAEAMQACAAENTAAGTVAEAGFRAALHGQDVRLALDTAYTDMAMQLRAHLNYLSTIVTLAPLLGLLGTISGMIESFSIFSVRAGEPLAITGGIGEALIATATGLCVAIFALIVHAYFAQRLDEMLAALDKTSTAVMAGLHRKGGRDHAS